MHEIEKQYEDDTAQELKNHASWTLGGIIRSAKHAAAIIKTEQERAAKLDALKHELFAAYDAKDRDAVNAIDNKLNEVNRYGVPPRMHRLTTDGSHPTVSGAIGTAQCLTSGWLNIG